MSVFDTFKKVSTDSNWNRSHVSRKTNTKKDYLSGFVHSQSPRSLTSCDVYCMKYFVGIRGTVIVIFSSNARPKTVCLLHYFSFLYAAFMRLNSTQEPLPAAVQEWNNSHLTLHYLKKSAVFFAKITLLYYFHSEIKSSTARRQRGADWLTSSRVGT